MKLNLFRLSRLVSVVTVFFTINSARAQFPGFGGFGGFGGFSGNRPSSSSSSSRSSNKSVGVGDAVISIDPETRSLVVIADEDTSRYISEVVSNLDRPQPQVLIKVVFLEVTRSDSSDIGVEGAYGKGLGATIAGMTTNFNVLTSSNGNTIVPTAVAQNPITTFSGGTMGLASGSSTANGLFQILGQDYQVTLRAIATAGRSRVLSRPSVVARNNQPATITIGQSVPLITNVRFDNFGNAINSVSYQSVGIILRVTPFISREGLVEMILSPETSELVADRSQWVPISTGGTNGSVSAPLINTRSADTVVVTPNGQTVIIGGLVESTKGDTESKIPFLGDIPLLGNLFKHKIKTDEKTELMIFLTPYIIDAPTQFASVSEKERGQSDAGRSLTETELNHFLENLPVMSTNTPPAKRKK